MTTNDTEERLRELAAVVGRLCSNLHTLVGVIQGEQPERREERLKAVRQNLQQGFSDSERIRHPDGSG